MDKLTREQALKEMLGWFIRRPDSSFAYSRCRGCDHPFWDREEHMLSCRVPQWRRALQSLSLESVRSEAQVIPVAAWVYAYTSLGCDLESAEKMVKAEIAKWFDEANYRINHPTLKPICDLVASRILSPARVAEGECQCYIHSGCPIHAAPESPAKEQPGEVAEMVKRLKFWAEKWEGLPVVPLLDEAAAFLAKLGQPPIPETMRGPRPYTREEPGASDE